jgi:site-specific DNA-methyltransferase (adenine-specific)
MLESLQTVPPSLQTTQTVILGDCLVEMSKLADKSVDMILCDLPYGTTACSWDTIIPFELLWAQYKRIIKDNGAIVLTASQPFTSALVMSNPDMFKYCWVWNKKKSANAMLAEYQPMKIHEDICIFSKKRHNYYPIKIQGEPRTDKKSFIQNGDNFGGDTVERGYENEDGLYNPKSIIEVSNANQTVKFHPTEKPVELFSYLVKTYTNEGDLILDNCAGSGTTGVAAKNLNRNFILIEKEPKYVEIIHERLKNTPNPLF